MINHVLLKYVPPILVHVEVGGVVAWLLYYIGTNDNLICPVEWTIWRI